MTDNSNPLHFIVSRPHGQGGNLITQLNQLTHETEQLTVTACPLIVISSYFDFNWQNSETNNASTSELTFETVDLSKFNGIIFVSRNAVENAKTRLSNENWEQLVKCPLYAIGKQTAETVETCVEHISNPPQVKYPQQMNSEGLLQMPELSNVGEQQWLLVKGLGGREKLKAGLQNSGASVAELDVYERKLPDLEAQKRIASYNQFTPDQMPAIWLISSKEALRNLWRILNKTPTDCQVIISSDRIAKEANKLGFKVVAQSKGATDQQLVDCVEQYIQKLS